MALQTTCHCSPAERWDPLLPRLLHPAFCPQLGSRRPGGSLHRQTLPADGTAGVHAKDAGQRATGVGRGECVSGRGIQGFESGQVSRSRQRDGVRILQIIPAYADLRAQGFRPENSMRGWIRPLTMDNALRQPEEKHLEWHPSTASSIPCSTPYGNRWESRGISPTAAT